MDISSIILKIGIAVVALGAGFSARYIFKSRPAIEKIVEDVAEEIVEEETGKDINFHPKDIDKKD